MTTLESDPQEGQFIQSVLSSIGQINITLVDDHDIKVDGLYLSLVIVPCNAIFWF